MARLLILSVILGGLLLFSCQKDVTSIEDSNSGSNEGASISFYFNKPAELSHLINTAKAVVSAPDMDTIFTDLTVSDSTVTGTIEEIPAGQHRHFEIFVYDSTEALTYYGDAYTDVPAGAVLTLYITLYPVSGTGTVIIVGTFAPFPPTGGKIVFEANYTGEYDIYIMNSDATGIINLTNFSLAPDLRPRQSPDMQKIFFLRNEGSINRPFLMNNDGSNIQELNIHPGSEIGYSDWSPDGQRMVITSYLDGDAELYVYEFSTGQITQLTFNNVRDWRPKWSPTGEWIGYQSEESGVFKTYLIRPDGSDKHRLTNIEYYEERGPTFSPDGSKICFTGRDVPAWDLFIVHLDGTNLTRLTHTPTINEINQSWSPDGARMLFVQYVGTNHGLYLLDLNTSQITPLLDVVPGDEENPHWR